MFSIHLFESIIKKQPHANVYATSGKLLDDSDFKEHTYYACLFTSLFYAVIIINVRRKFVSSFFTNLIVRSLDIVVETDRQNLIRNLRMLRSKYNRVSQVNSFVCFHFEN